MRTIFSLCSYFSPQRLAQWMRHTDTHKHTRSHTNKLECKKEWFNSPQLNEEKNYVHLLEWLSELFKFYRQPRFIVSTSGIAKLPLIIRIFWVIFLFCFFLSFIFSVYFRPCLRVSGKFFLCFFLFAVSFSRLLNWSALVKYARILEKTQWKWFECTLFFDLLALGCGENENLNGKWATAPTTKKEIGIVGQSISHCLYAFWNWSTCCCSFVSVPSVLLLLLFKQWLFPQWPKNVVKFGILVCTQQENNTKNWRIIRHFGK